MKSHLLILLLLIGIWIGLIVGLSFIETPLKFRAPGITTQLGVGIGKIVFSVLNKIEILFALILLIIVLIEKLIANMDSIHLLSFIFLMLIILLQSVWLLPALDDRAQALINGEEYANHSYHLLYVIAEIGKLMTLFVLFIKFYKS